VKDALSKQCSECKRGGVLCAPPGDGDGTDSVGKVGSCQFCECCGCTLGIWLGYVSCQVEGAAAAGVDDRKLDEEDDVMFISPKFDATTLQAHAPGCSPLGLCVDCLGGCLCGEMHDVLVPCRITTFFSLFVCSR
jgi:hypothetical protein